MKKREAFYRDGDFYVRYYNKKGQRTLVVGPSGSMVFKNGKRHSSVGPAVITPTGYSGFFLDDVQLSQKAWEQATGGRFDATNVDWRKMFKKIYEDEKNLGAIVSYWDDEKTEEIEIPTHKEQPAETHPPVLEMTISYEKTNGGRVADYEEHAAHELRKQVLRSMQAWPHCNHCGVDRELTVQSRVLGRSNNSNYEFTFVFKCPTCKEVERER